MDMILYIEVKDNVAKLLSDTPSHIDTTIKTTHEVWQKISFNELSGQDALLNGLVTCEGSMKNFALMPKLFDRELPKESDSEEYSENNSNKKSETNNKEETFNEDLSKPKATNKNKELMPINTIMNGMVAGFEPSKAKYLHIKYKFSFDDHEPIYLEIKNNTALETATLFAFPLYHLFSVINPIIFNYEISALFLNGILILTLLISSFTKSNVMGEYSELSLDTYITKSKLFRIINKNLTLLWNLIFTIRFLMEFFIPRPLNNLAYIFIVIGIIVSYKYPKKKMGH